MSKKDSRKGAATVLGWIAGGSVGLIVSAALSAGLGERYPLVVGNFVLFIAGAFAGMALSDRYGARSIKPLAMVTGVLFSLGIFLLMAVFSGGR